MTASRRTRTPVTPLAALSRGVRRAGRAVLARGDARAPIREGRAALIGLDVSRTPIRLRTRSWAPLVVAGILGAMFLAVLRVDVMRTRFALAESVEEEIRLEGLKRELTVEMRTLRDPSALARRARELGFGLAERLIDLSARPSPAAPAPSTAPGPRTFAVAGLDDAPLGARP